jgi:hypothetical protein
LLAVGARGPAATAVRRIALGVCASSVAAASAEAIAVGLAGACALDACLSGGAGVSAAAAVGGVVLEVCAGPVAAGLPGWAGVAAGAAVLRVGLGVDALVVAAGLGFFARLSGAEAALARFLLTIGVGLFPCLGLGHGRPVDPSDGEARELVHCQEQVGGAHRERVDAREVHFLEEGLVAVGLRMAASAVAAVVVIAGGTKVRDEWVVRGLEFDEPGEVDSCLGTAPVERRASAGNRAPACAVAIGAPRRGCLPRRARARFLGAAPEAPDDPGARHARTPNPPR